MKSIKGNWILLFLLSVFVLIFVFYQSLFQLFATPPSKNWSRALKIAEIKKTDSTDYDATNIATVPLSLSLSVMPSQSSPLSQSVPHSLSQSTQTKNVLLLFWTEGKTLHYSLINQDGAVSRSEIINFDFPQFSKIGATVVNKNIFIFGLVGKSLWCYEFSLSNDHIISKKRIDDNVTTFITHENHLVYSTDKAVFIRSSSGKNLMVADLSAKLLNATKASNGLLYILVTSEDRVWDVTFSYAAYDEDTQHLKRYKGFKIGIEHRCVLVNSSFGIDEDSNCISLLEIVKKVETLDVFGLNIIFPIEGTSSPVIHQLGIAGFHPNPIVTNYKFGSTYYIATAENKIGLTTSKQNLFLFQLKNGEISKKEMLTKTEGISSSPQLFSIGSDQYLVWEDIGIDYKKIYFASTNSAAYEMSKKLSVDDHLKLASKTAIGCLSAVLLIFLMSSILAIFTVAVLLLVSMVALNWVEANQNKLLNLCILFQFAANMLFTLHSTNKLYNIKPVLPMILQNVPGILCVVFVTTSIAAYCVKKKYPKTSNSSIFEQFLFFEVLNLVLHSLVYYPYYSL